MDPQRFRVYEVSASLFLFVCWVAVMTVAAVAIDRVLGYGWGTLLATPVGVFTGLLAYVKVRSWLPRYFWFDLALARSEINLDGVLLHLDNMTVWFEGREHPQELLQREHDEARRRLEAFLGQPLARGVSPRVFVFFNKDRYDKYFLKRDRLYGVFDFMYECVPPRLVLFYDLEGEHLLDTCSGFRSAFLRHALEQHKGFDPDYWLSSGLSGYLAIAEDSAKKALLHRRLRAFVRRQALLPPTAMFSMTLDKIAPSLFAANTIAPFAIADLLHMQHIAFIQYLCEDPVRRSAFVEFVRTTDKRDAVSLRRCFNTDLEGLYASWQTWMASVESGSAQTPPRLLEDALREYLIPALEAKDVPSKHKFEIIRHMGRAGFRLGAEQLLPYVRSSDARLRDAAVWALERISGEPLGQDADAWNDWVLSSTGSPDAALDARTPYHS